ncbi:MAG: diphthine--ammonia ligase [Candidatus Nanoarchaeia archaeon]|nr:diphthine--ammonia ligase [Candidatus Nanoarchaeia archaeon]
MDNSLEQVKKALMSAVKSRIPKEKFGILFSGGLDSILIARICRELKADFICYTAGFDNQAEDIEKAQIAAKALNFKLKTRIANPEQTLKKVLQVLNDSNPIQIGVAMPLYAACEMAKEDVKVVLNGTGADELFGGYARYKKTNTLNKDCRKDFLAIQSKDCIRDAKIAEANNLTAISPFMDEELAKLALSLPPEKKIGEHNKLILRQIAISMGVPEAIAMRAKKAAQYGSNADKAIEKLAKGVSKTEYLSSLLKKPMKLGVLFSSGKDSCYALHLMQKQKHEISCLITIKSKNKDSFMFHTPAIEITELQSKAMEIPIMYHETEGEKEEELKDLEEAIRKAKKQYQIEGIVTGALYSEYQSDRIQKIADKLGLKSFSPLWHKNQETELRELIENGFEFIFTAVAADGLDKSWLGKVITEKDIDKLVKINEKNGMNIAGEGGETESLVLNAPFFKKKIIIEKAEIKMESECVGRLIIEKAALE